ncbi:SDR family NAD(P)-dependent oxidoreductase [Dactylosporangium sp. AC04546]|uniref:SDR family NAD(P)-dependent oxidoreductase n=1 Tax=Dactylosporangium sp. AC04546 TaxID=2862460 RepID=UPI001EDCA53D|nr:SDR family NAD(P)-dependent oxidoreductase [Dactylosporangium sp. AC04546]WVK86973.1 SDR family NAD(P)-dependent oxidoreductase [Dactylosporangium sp. AC04546]
MKRILNSRRFVPWNRAVESTPITIGDRAFTGRGGRMANIDFSDKVAIVTGGGRGIGRAYALLLASRGAAVVVNDPGVQPRGEDPDASVAVEVVKEIEAAGGRAVASLDSVATVEGGAAIVETALNAFGRVDLLVHNAGVVAASTFADQPIEEVHTTLAVHLLGAWHVGQPAWRDMEKRGYGRIVLTTSMAQFGHFRQPAYSAAKTGVIGLVKSLAHEARHKDIDIKVNAVAPLAGTRLARTEDKERWGELIAPENVAAVAAYLLSSECPVSGEVIHAGGTHFARGFLAQTRGWSSGVSPLTPEQVRRHFDEAFDRDNYEIPADANDQMEIVKRTVLG